MGFMEHLDVKGEDEDYGNHTVFVLSSGYSDV
jgi:hypothetical protein